MRGYKNFESDPHPGELEHKIEIGYTENVINAAGVLLLMNASGENFLPKSRGYAKIGIGSQYGLAKISFDFTLQGGAACQSRMSMITLLSSITSRAAGAIL